MCRQLTLFDSHCAFSLSTCGSSTTSRRTLRSCSVNLHTSPRIAHFLRQLAPHVQHLTVHCRLALSTRASRTTFRRAIVQLLGQRAPRVQRLTAHSALASPTRASRTKSHCAMPIFSVNWRLVNNISPRIEHSIHQLAPRVQPHPSSVILSSVLSRLSIVPRVASCSM